MSNTVRRSILTALGTGALCASSALAAVTVGTGIASAAVTPVVDSVIISPAKVAHPADLPATGGYGVGICGQNFFETGSPVVSAVDFGSSPANLSALSTVITAGGCTDPSFPGDDEIVIAAPASPGDASGTFDVTVTTDGGPSLPVPGDQVTYVPTVTSISPSGGPLAGGTAVTITGAGFEDSLGNPVVTSLEMHLGTPATTAPFTFDASNVASATSITETTPSWTLTNTKPQIAHVILSDGAVQGYGGGSFLYEPAPIVGRESPLQGPAQYPVTVKITGSCLQGAVVEFGLASGTVSVNPIYDSGTSITVTSPLDSSGTVDVVPITVVTPGGSVAAGQITLYPQPVITSVSPAGKAGGQEVTVFGTGFSFTSPPGPAGATVTIGTTKVSNIAFVQPSPGQPEGLVVRLPSGYAGQTNVVVTTKLGGASAPATYSYPGGFG
jgi:hypothetical protein